MDMIELDKHDDDAVFEVGSESISKTELKRRLKEEMDSVRISVVAQRDEWVRHRASTGVEERWRRANALYHGEENSDTLFVDTLKNGPQSREQKRAMANRSRVVINIVRPKTDQAIARMCEILLPTDDKNWGIKMTPVAESVSRMLGDMRQTVHGATTPAGVQGQPTGMTADAEAQKFVADARKKAERMELAIDDQLTECKYNAEQRCVITDGVKLGTGILLGPFPAKQTSKTWAAATPGSPAELKLNKKTVPASIHADPWDVWFDPACGKDHQNGAGFWHKRMVTRKQIRALDGVLGFDQDALRGVLETQPSRISTAEGRVRKTYAIKEQAYEMWTYHGEVEPDQMRMMTQNTGDPLSVDFAVVMMINDRIVGAMKSWIADKSLPVDVWCWRQADDSPYGYGLPNELEHQQRVVNSAWRQVMDNARFAVGSQIVFLDGVVPTDGSREITPGKLWSASPDKIDDARKAMAAIDIPSHLGELLQIAEKAMEYADMETSMPQIIGGEQGSAPETVGGMVMLNNNAQAVLRLRVKLYDDDITNPHISRYYDWNMANNPDNEIKGDMEVDARGSTALLEKDIQNQATLNLAAVTSNPRYAAYLDPKEELKVVLKAFKIQPETIMATDDQIKKNLSAPPPQDPRLAAAEMAMQAKQLDIKDRAEQRRVDVAQDAAMRQEKAADRDYNQRREQGEFVIAQTHEQNLRDMKMLSISSDERKTAAQIEADAGIAHLEIDNKRELFNAEAALRVNTGQGI